MAGKSLWLAQTLFTRVARGGDEFSDTGLLKIFNCLQRHVAMHFAFAAQELMSIRQGGSKRDPQLHTRLTKHQRADHALVTRSIGVGEHMGRLVLAFFDARQPGTHELARLAGERLNFLGISGQFHRAIERIRISQSETRPGVWQHESRRGSMNVVVPRRDLIAGVQMAIKKGELKMARGIAAGDAEEFVKMLNVHNVARLLLTTELRKGRSLAEVCLSTITSACAPRVQTLVGSDRHFAFREFASNNCSGFRRLKHHRTLLDHPDDVVCV